MERARVCASETWSTCEVAGIERRWVGYGRWAVALMAGAVASAGGTGVARAEKIPNNVAVFSALDKVTARISRIEVPLNQTYRFGSLKVTPRVCYTRPPKERPKTTSFVEVDEVLLDGTQKHLFSGWMFAQSPGLNAVEHPVFDVWLIDCTNKGKQTAEGDTRSQPSTDEARTAAPPPRRRRRVRR
jgi:hypothetical protein